MEKIIQSIFCCSGESNDHQRVPSNYKTDNISNVNNNKNSNNDNNKSKKTSKTSLNVKQEQLQRHSSKSQGTLNAPLLKKTDRKDSKRTLSKHTAGETQEHSANEVTKSDVNVYEATDSTVDTSEGTAAAENGASRTSVSLDQNIDSDKTISSAQSDNNNNHHESHVPEESIDSVNVSDEEYGDFMDLTQIQPGQAHASSGWLLNPAPEKLKNRKCLILDLDETLVHSSFKYLRQADFVIPVDIDNQLHNVYVIKRPGVDDFLKRVGEIYEVVVFTASVARYGDPLLDELDIHKSVHHRLFRDSCFNYQGNFIKNLSQIGRPLNEIIILDNSPASYIFHPQHAIPISSWFSDAHDNELLDIIPFLEDLSKDNVEDIGVVLDINL